MTQSRVRRSIGRWAARSSSGSARIVLVYDGRFVDPRVYDRPVLNGNEHDGLAFQAFWQALREFGPAAPLYPDGLLELLAQLDSRDRRFRQLDSPD